MNVDEAFILADLAAIPLTNLVEYDNATQRVATRTTARLFLPLLIFESAGLKCMGLLVYLVVSVLIN